MYDFQKFYEEVTNLIKAIGTTSSANQPADERSVENYVRQSANTNSQIGGNQIVSNTTEPDPTGDIAVQKAVGSETNPNGNISTGDAPEGPVPTQGTIPSDATSAVAPSKTDEVNTPDKVTIAKGEKCPTCGAIAKGDETEEEAAIEKAADEPESKEEAAKETPEDEKAEMKKSLWGGAFAPVK